MKFLGFFLEIYPKTRHFHRPFPAGVIHRGVYQGADFTLKADTPDLQAALEASIGEKFDMSFECCGVPAALNSCIEVTIPGGVVCVVANMPKTVHVDLQVACRHEVHYLLMNFSFYHQEGNDF